MSDAANGEIDGTKESSLQDEVRCHDAGLEVEYNERQPQFEQSWNNHLTNNSDDFADFDEQLLELSNVKTPVSSPINSVKLNFKAEKISSKLSSLNTQGTELYADDNEKVDKSVEVNSKEFLKLCSDSDSGSEENFKYSEGSEEDSDDFSNEMNEKENCSGNDLDLNSANLNEDENKDTESKKIPIKHRFNIDFGSVEFPSSDLKTEFGNIDTSKVRDCITYSMQEVIGCKCPLRFYGSIRQNQLSVTAYAKCATAEHTQFFKFVIDNYMEKNTAILMVYSTHAEIHVTHQKSTGKAVVHSQIRGKKRDDMKDNVRHKSVAVVHKEILIS